MAGNVERFQKLLSVLCWFGGPPAAKAAIWAVGWFNERRPVHRSWKPQPWHCRVPDSTSVRCVRLRCVSLRGKCVRTSTPPPGPTLAPRPTLASPPKMAPRLTFGPAADAISAVDFGPAARWEFATRGPPIGCPHVRSPEGPTDSVHKRVSGLPRR